MVITLLHPRTPLAEFGNSPKGSALELVDLVRGNVLLLLCPVCGLPMEISSTPFAGDIFGDWRTINGKISITTPLIHSCGSKFTVASGEVRLG